MGTNKYQQLCDRGMSSRKCIRPKEMDGYEIYFENSDEEFYRTPAILSDEMWKKFELILTPPRSPNRESDWNLDLDVENELLSFSSDGDFCNQEAVDNFIKELTTDQSSSQNLSSNLIQDPMWPQVNTTPPSESKLENGQNTKRLRCDSCSRPTFDVHASECVDPAAVFPYPIGGTIAETKVHSLGIDTPSDSEEEIDVVTVEKKQQMQTVPTPVKKKGSVDTEREHQVQKSSGTLKLTIESKPAQKSLIRPRVDASTEDHFYSLPHSYSLKRSMRSCPSSPESDSPRPIKRQKAVDFKHVVQRLKSCRASSDSDECETGKRTQHNVLERKRRTDLKLSFFSLRDSVPELQGQERAPKVLILKKAADYIHSLNSESKRCDRDIESLKVKQEQLKRTLAALRGF
ncbi:hypothetical protein CHS0354_024615 [Potamilus streckersoni]|uniref:BHLH domain-containing protein n=1 Tax=Potamilus streckersoni TaxID=2493646 RepID=A0AAE0S3J2_9BIVA|nr:hypothetical protein CHS0354_024615 [Potamilus streckersoni]